MMLPMEFDRAQLTAFYQRYIQRCNEHRFAELGEFVDQDVEVNGARVGLQAYAAGLTTVVQAFPDVAYPSECRFPQGGLRVALHPVA